MSNNKFKILIVEDEPTICSFIYTLLDTNGYKTYVAPTCELGKSIFTSYLPDLIILDLGLPDRDGRELIHYVRQKFMTPVGLELKRLSRSAARTRASSSPVLKGLVM